LIPSKAPDPFEPDEMSMRQPKEKKKTEKKNKKTK